MKFADKLGLMSLAQMARRIGVTGKWLRQQAESGRLPAFKVGRRWLFHVEAVLDRLIELTKGDSK
jgi:excisionase family DNA binding protein